jgi:hypothetical protein
MATPAYIKSKISENLIRCCKLSKFEDGYSCEFQYVEPGRKSLFPSTAKSATRIWLTHNDVMQYVTEQIGWTGLVFDQHNNRIQ